MKRLTIILLGVAALLCSCSGGARKVNARHVPERMDDFVFENDFYCFRVYGKALEGNPTSPGFDFWAKNCDTLVAEGRYRLYAEGNDAAYHRNLGNGKDCYKVGVSLGAGASSPFINDTLRFPATNYRSYEIISLTPKEAVFVLHYPKWESCGYSISLDKKFTVTAGKKFCKVEDTWSFTGPGETLRVAAGIYRHDEKDIVDEYNAKERIAIWEHASDQSLEKEDGLIGVAVVMPDAEGSSVSCGHSLVWKDVKSREPLTYYFSAVWSEFSVPTAQDWFDIVKRF